MTVTEPRRAYRRVRWVYAHELERGDVVCSDDGPWTVLFSVPSDGRVVIVSDSGWVFGCSSVTRFKVQVTEAGR